ncbi:uncharacterized protein LOC110862295 isoform X2 [Folsomia candida]|uniref:uncharacterized protein LOC110862295 isoform X2 n=1 Tax=Folsomia candida TaxID=158441 RepID=UPI000B8FE831|nr:uncharacterized protein LOC110862295 isoform X2 [Folsomia candida]
MPPKSMKVKGDESDSFTDYDEDYDEMSGSDDTTPKKRPRFSKDMDTSGYESTPHRVTRSGGGTSSAAARSELRGAFGDDDDVTVGESTDDDDDGLEDPDELIGEKVDLNEWKLGQIDDIFEKIKAKINAKTGTGRQRMDVPILQTFMHEYENVKQATEIPPEMTVKDYFAVTPPPTDNQEYNNAVANIEKQIADRENYNVKLSCPLLNCETKFMNLTESKRHILTKHLKMRLFGCKKCPLKSWTNYVGLRHHILSKHFDLKHTCPDCLIESIS